MSLTEFYMLTPTSLLRIIEKPSKGLPPAQAFAEVAEKRHARDLWVNETLASLRGCHAD